LHTQRCSITGGNIDQLRGIGIDNVRVLPKTGVMFANLTQAQISELRSLNCTVEPIGSVKPSVWVPQPQPGAQLYTPEQLLDAVGIDDLRDITLPPLYGQGLNVAVIDTGIRHTHAMINGKFAYSQNFSHGPDGDGFNHGTGVASILLAAMPLCNLLDMKVLNDNGEGTTEEVIEAIESCISLWDASPEIAPIIINLSIGGTDTGNPNDPLRVACRAALENRIWVIAAAGNDGPEPETVKTPAVEKYVLAVGSVSPETLTVSVISSRGPARDGEIKPDVVFFGENIIVASSESDNAVV